MTERRPNAVGICTGKKESGKSTLLRDLVAPSRRLLIVDPEWTWDELGDPGAGAGTETVYSAAQLVGVLRALRAEDKRRRFRIVYRDHSLEAMQLAAPYAALAVGHCTLCIDELAVLCGPRRIPVWLERVLRTGRHRGVNLLGTTREPQEIHDRFFGAADAIWLFRTEPSNALERLRARYGKEKAAQLEGLGVGEYLVHGDPKKVQRLIGREGLKG